MFICRFSVKIFHTYRIFRVCMFVIALAAWNGPVFSEVATVENGWEYRTGDSPIDARGIPDWISSDEKDPAWKSIPLPANVHDRGPHNVIWFRVMLPHINLEQPALHLTDIDQDFAVFYDGEQIYSFGSEKDYLSSFGSHIIQMNSYNRKYLYMRVHSEWERLGMYGSKLEVGDRIEITRNIIMRDFKYIFISSVLIVAGILIIFGAIFRLETSIFVNLGIFTMILGLYSFLRTDLKQFIWGNYYQFWGAAELLILFLIPVFANSFLCRILSCTWKSPLSYFRVFTAAYAIGSCIIALINPNLLVLMLTPFFYILGMNALTATIIAAVQTLKGKSDARQIFLAIVIFSICGAHDVIQEMGIIKMTILMVPWGQLFLIFVMLRIAVRNSLNSRKNLILMEKELDIARRIQMKTIPHTIPEVSGIVFGVGFYPIIAVGGDLYDFYHSDDGGFGILIADAAGHGIPAALIASMANIAFTTNRHHVSEPSLLIERMNSTLLGKCEKYFISALIAYISKDRSTVRFARAGHLPLLIFRRATAEIETTVSHGRILGRFKTANCQDVELPIMKGDRLIFQSDGIIEGKNKSGELFGTDRFMDLILNTAELSAQAACRKIIDKTHQWTRSDSNTDDITLILADIV